MVTLKDLCDFVGAKADQINFDAEIRCLQTDSRLCDEFSVFVPLNGAHVNGCDFIKNAQEHGAVAVLISNDNKPNDMQLQDISIPLIYMDKNAYFYAAVATWLNDYPSKKLKLIGITGTNGKSTITSLISQWLTLVSGAKVGLLGTLGYGFLPNLHKSANTTLDAINLQRVLGEMVKDGARYAVMEVSSIGVCEGRIQGCEFAAGGFTNLTRDHLDYHGTMENYFQAKRRVFTMCKTAVINIDDEYGKRLAQEFSDIAVTYSTEGDADYHAEFIRMNATGCSYMLVNEREKTACRVDMNMTGLYNVQNSLCAIAMVTALGFDMTECAKALSDLDGVDGRMNVVYRGDFTVITDYAHTDDALIKVLSTLKPLTKGRLICVFGAAGDRDKEKRPMMAKAAEDNADILVITSDNPAHENPDEIIREVMTGISGKKPCRCITDRREAIAYALDTARKDDVIILCGKGHETYQIIGDEYLPFSEKEIVKDIMKRKEN